MQLKCVSMNVIVSHGVFDIVAPSQCESVDVCVVPIGSGMMKYPCRVPMIPLLTVPAGFKLDWQAPGLGFGCGLSIAGVTKLPFLNCSTTVNVPSGLCWTVKWRSNMSFAQSLPQVPESVEPLVYGP